MVTAGFLLVALADSIWAARFRADALILFGIEKLDCAFCHELSWYGFGNYEAFICAGVVIWLIGYAIRRVAKSTSSVLRR